MVVGLGLGKKAKPSTETFGMKLMDKLLNLMTKLAT